MSSCGVVIRLLEREPDPRFVFVPHRHVGRAHEPLSKSLRRQLYDAPSVISATTLSRPSSVIVVVVIGSRLTWSQSLLIYRLDRER